MTGAVLVSQLDLSGAELSPGFADLFDTYRQHYGQPAALAESISWLRSHLENGSLIGFQAENAGVVAGFALAASLPASQRLSHFWQLRDLFVPPAQRRMGVAKALVRAVRDAALASGALRLVLQTEIDNSAAIDLYVGLGFERVDGYVGLLLPLRG